MKPKPDTTIKLTAFACIAISLFIGATLLMRSINRGDGTPAGSTHRTDPRGCKALYEALAQIPELTVERNYHQFSQCDLPSDAVLFLHACGPVVNASDKINHSFDMITINQFMPIDEFVRRGGRLIVTVSDSPNGDENAKLWLDELPTPTTPIPQPNPGIPGAEDTPAMTTDSYMTPFICNWGVDLETAELETTEDGMRFIPVLVKPADPSRFPRLQWHSRHVINRRSPGWNIIYRRGKKPVIVERKIGKGSVVVAGDNFFLSNQGLRETPSGSILIWLLGGKRHVILDEWHLGVGESVGVATLFYRYRLQWIVIAAVIIALLFVWRSATPLAPYPEYHMDRSQDDEAIDGRGAAAGYVQLLQRFFPPTEILQVCYDEWLKDIGTTKTINDKTDEEIRSIITDPAVKREEELIVDGYRRISNDLQQSK